MLKRTGLIAMSAGAVFLPAPHSVAFTDVMTAQKNAQAQFSIKPPAPYRAVPFKHRAFNIAVAIRSAPGKAKAVSKDSNLCIAGFGFFGRNSRFTREQMNRRTGREAQLNYFREVLSRRNNVIAFRKFMHQGYRGIEMFTSPKNGPGAGKVREFTAMIATSKGRTVLSCKTNEAEFDGALKDFRAIRATINAPR